MNPEKRAAQQNATTVSDPNARIGPNAIIRLAEATDTLHGEQCTRTLFDATGLSDYLDRPPGQLVDETDVIALYRTSRAHLGPASFTAVAQLAGRLTGDYVLTHRIPPLARAILPWLPRPIAARILAKAISAHAWTFVGSGLFSYQLVTGGLALKIENSPLARGQSADVPICNFYAATFERIFQSLIDRRTQVIESTCCAMADQACHFDVRFNGTPDDNPAA